MYTQKLHPSAKMPSIMAKDLNGNELDITKIQGDAQWKMVVVYRGRHCPLCTKYLNNLKAYIERLNNIGIETVAVSGDSKEQLLEQMTKLSIDFNPATADFSSAENGTKFENLNFPIYHGLTLESMKELGLWISEPRSEQETDHPFSEPAIFVINEEGGLQVVDISNNPFVRPDLEVMVSGLEWIRKVTYPIRGALKY